MRLVVSSFVLVSLAGLALAFRPQTKVAVQRTASASQTTGFVPACEERIEIEFLPFIAGEPGSYVLVRSLDGIPGHDAILIDADDVTIDLAGHVLRGVPAALAGIRAQPGLRNSAVRNGTVRGFPADGVILSGEGSRIEGVRALENGGSGLALGAAGLVLDSQAVGNGIGIHVGPGTLVERCTASENLDVGILLVPVATATGSVVRASSARSNGGAGIVAGDGCVIEACSATLNMGPGISAGPGTVISHCALALNSGAGVTGSGVLVRGNAAANNGGAAYDVSGGTLLENHP